MESCGNVRGFLAGHRVGDKYDVMRFQRCLQARQLIDQLFVYLQATGGIDQYRVMATGFGSSHRARGDFDWILLLVAVEQREFAPARRAREVAPSRPGDKRRSRPI